MNQYRKISILEFINLFSVYSDFNSGPIKQVFLNGFCYYFTVMLKSRFRKGNICYLPNDGHFIFEFENKFYDIEGDCTEHYKNHKIYKWNEYKNVDLKDYKKVKKGIIMKNSVYLK